MVVEKVFVPNGVQTWWARGKEGRGEEKGVFRMVWDSSCGKASILG